MKKNNSKKIKVICGSLSAVGLLIPTIAISAVACSSEFKPGIDKNQIILNTKPVNVTIFLNQNENLPVLSVEAKAVDQNTKLAYQWYENDHPSNASGKMITDATQSTYTIPKSYAQKVGTRYFYVVVSAVVENNIVNSVISNIYTVKTSEKLPPIIVTSQSVNQNAIINQIENLPTFSVNATTGHADEKLNYQWYSNVNNSNTGGTLIQVAINPSYTVPQSDVSALGQKYYYVEISGTISGSELLPIKSNVAVLTIDSFPIITISSQPQNLETIIYQQTNRPTFSVAVNPIQDAQLTYQWYSNTVNSNTNGTLIKNANNASYTIPYSDVQNIGTKYFYVQIGGMFDQKLLSTVTSKVSTLTINYQPRITISSSPQSLEAIVNQTENLPTFSVAVNPIQDAQFSYQWYKNGTYIPGANSSSYTVPASDAKEKGQKTYQAQVSGFLYGTALTPANSRASMLNVKDPPKIAIRTQPVNQTTILGTTVSPTFSVDVNPIQDAKFTYQWYKHDSTNNQSAGWSKIANATNSSYAVPISELIAGSIKQYYVEINGSLNGVKLSNIDSSIGSLSVNLPTISISKQPVNKTINLWESNLATFSVSATTEDEKAVLNYQWYQNNTLISGANSPSYTVPVSELTAGTTKEYSVEIGGEINGTALQKVKSDVVNLRVNALPAIKINQQPTDKNVTSWTPDLPTFSVSVNPIQDAQFSYQWYSATGSNNNWQLISGATNSSYTVQSSDVLVPGTQKRYYAKITGTIRNIPLISINSNVATLRVNDSPNITISHNPQNTIYYVK